MKRLSALWANDKLINSCTFIGDKEVLISSVCIHTNDCKKHSLFVAQVGIHYDGHDFITKAIEMGASAVVHSSTIETFIDGITYIKTPTPHLVASLIAYHLYGPYPSSIIGVTGTDGKSTSCEFLYAILTSNRIKCGLLTTTSIDTGSGKKMSPYRMSTPNVDKLFPFLHECYKNKVDHVILETTSHGLSENTARLKHITFSGAIITNITSEHLDFHRTISSYVNDKMNLVKQLSLNAPIVIQDTFTYRDIVESLLADPKQLSTYAVEMPSEEASIRAITSNISLDKRTLLLQKKGEEIEFSLSYAPSIYTNNFIASLTLASTITKKSLKELLDPHLKIEKIPGRYEILYRKNGKIIINDFAHTKNGFFTLFSFIRMLYPQRRIIALFGAAGERDTSKREALGEMASTFCDILYLTNEDSRGEEVIDIIHDIKKGFITGKTIKVYEVLDRKDAVKKAISRMQEDDILLLLGKGHEKSIDHGTYIEEYDETQIALDIIKDLE